MKGIILAAGKGTRLYPMTLPVCKPLLPVYDKPLIYYSVAVLIEAGIRDILIIIPPGEEDTFYRLLGDGSELGIRISYEVQHVARGIADAFIIGREFIGNDSICLVLGDNIFYSDSLNEKLRMASENREGAVVFGYWVEDPRPFGVVEFDDGGRAVSIEEKPAVPKSNYIIPGLYFYDNNVLDIAASLKPSQRGELEITDVNVEYMNRGKLQVIPLEKDFVWLDAGTADSLLEAGNTIKQLQSKGKYIGCIEELAYEKGFIEKDRIYELGQALEKTEYGSYLIKKSKE